MQKYLIFLFSFLPFVSYSVHEIHFTLDNVGENGTITYLVAVEKGKTSIKQGELAPGETITLSLSQNKIGAPIKGKISVAPKSNQSIACVLKYERVPSTQWTFTQYKNFVPAACSGFSQVIPQNLHSSHPHAYFTVNKNKTGAL